MASGGQAPGNGLTRRQHIHFFRQLDVERRQPSCIMGGERHLDLVPDIEPFGVVIHFLRHERNTRHPAKGFAEIPEFELFTNRVASIGLAPFVQA